MTIHLVHEGYWASYNNPFFPSSLISCIYLMHFPLHLSHLFISPIYFTYPALSYQPCRPDMTIHLVHEGYWASYNNPFFTDIANVSGNAVLCQMNSNTCYDHDPRANIFREHQDKVKDIAGTWVGVGVGGCVGGF